MVAASLSAASDDVSWIQGGGVARHDGGRYSLSVRKFCWQRWALMFLLMTRLVVGEFSHAMPMQAMGAMDHATSGVAADAEACPEHDTKSQSAPQISHEMDHSSGEQDCCKSGECECPCLHVPCASFDVIGVNRIAPTEQRGLEREAFIISQRPSGLFRPPA